MCTKASYSHTGTKGTCKDSSCTVNSVQGSVTGYKGVSVVGERALMSTVALQQVSIAIETYQSSFQSHRDAIYAARAYAPAESFKKDLKMLRVRQEFECVNSLGQESNSQAVKEGGLMSIRDDESDGRVSEYSTQLVVLSVHFLLCLCLFSVCQS